jgi:hypothetical protein
MPTLTLSQLVAGRELAAEAMRKLGPVEGTHVVVDARPLVSGSTSFAGQLVRSALLDGRAAELTILGGPAEFLADVKIAAEQLQVTDHVAFAPTDADLGVHS